MKVRVAAMQYMLRPIAGWEDFERQVQMMLEAAAEYRPQFVLMPEILTTQLMSCIPRQDVPGAVRALDQFTERYRALMRGHAQRHGYYLIAGSHPAMRDGELYNTSFLFSPHGEVFSQDKIHRTRWERERWKTSPGNQLNLYETEFGDIAILVCYDIEFPELARKVCEAGADILFVPSSTDDRQGFWRVRYCCHARAIENQVYVVMASTVGSLPVEGLGLHYGQASILTPSDFPFSRDGIAAEGMANTEQIVIADLELQLLFENRVNGTTIPLYDKRKEVYESEVNVIKSRPPVTARAEPQTER
jgi:predicted amidohydrolase